MTDETAVLCKIDGCGRHLRARGFCSTHYERWRRNGDPAAASPVAVLGGPVEERFWAKVSPTGFCWEWTAHHSARGYGGFEINGRSLLAHRVSYEILVGAIPEGMVLDHLCRNRGCVNPDHLEVVTSAENTRRGFGPAMQTARSGRCAKGHEMTESNTYVSGDQRDCRSCSSDRARARRAKRKEAGQ